MLKTKEVKTYIHNVTKLVKNKTAKIHFAHLNHKAKYLYKSAEITASKKTLPWQREGARTTSARMSLEKNQTGLVTVCKIVAVSL